MKKVMSFILIAAGLLISGQGKAEMVASVTIGDQVTEYATLAEAVAYAQTYGEGLIQLLDGYSATAYPQAWVTPCTIDGPTGYENRDKAFFTYHGYNPNNGDEAIGEKKYNEELSDAADIARFVEILKEVDPSFNPEGKDIPGLPMKRLNGYADWHADFEVYFSHDIDAEDYVIAGNYGDWGWRSTDQDDQPLSRDMKKGERIRLLQNWDPNLKYWELLNTVRQFHCGVISLNENANAGKTIYVDLFMYAEGNEDIRILIGTTPYTFPMKSIVIENKVEETVANKEILDELKAENAGVKAMTDEMTNIYPATSTYQTDKSKTIIVVLTDIKVETVVMEYQGTLESITYNVTPKYIDADGNMQTIPNEYITQPITFRLPIASNFAGKVVDVYHKANDKALEDYVGKFEVKKLGDSYYVELSASEFSEYIIKDEKNYYERETTVGMIGTICVPYDIVEDSLVESKSGAEFFEINYRNNATTTEVSEVEGEQVSSLEGGKAYVFVATSELVHVGWAKNATHKEVVTTGTMIGNLSLTAIYPAALYEKNKMEPYVVTMNGDFRPCGPQAYVSRNRAYLNMYAVPTSKTPAPAAARRIVLGKNGANITTHLENVNVNVNANRKMMVNGQLVIIRDGKKFNAQGQEL